MLLLDVFARLRGPLRVLAALAPLLLGTGVAQAGIIVTYEPAGVTGPNRASICAGMGTCVVGTETFSDRTSWSGFTTDFGLAGQVITGVYSGTTGILPADQYGGAGGNGRYAATFTAEGYALRLTTTLPTGINYFGYYLSALDRGNVVTFYDQGAEIFSFAPNDFIRTVGSCPSTFCGNPDAPMKGSNPSEPYAFLNFFFGEKKIDRVAFQEKPQWGGYESDNHTVGYVTALSGTKIPVPAPGGLACFLAGLAGLAGVRATRRAAA